MRETTRLRNYFFVLILGFTLVIIGIHVGQAQVKVKGKPPKPPKINCDSNGICESGEYNYKLDHESQQCDDCVLEEYGSLVIEQTQMQIVGANFQIGKIFQFKSQNSYYRDTWACNKIENIEFLHPEIGDIDGDGTKEILAIATYKYKIGRGKKAQNYYDQKVFVFRDGSDGSLIETSSNIGYSPNYLWQTLLANVDGEIGDELILHKWWQTEIYKWNGEDFELKWIRYYDDLSFRVAVGNADNDDYGTNELLIGSSDGGRIHVLQFQGEDLEGYYLFSEETLPPFENCCIDSICVKDADNDRLNEIVAGGNNSKLMVWKYDGMSYIQAGISEPLAGYAQELDIGDLDGDVDNEVVVGTVWDNVIYVLEYYNPDPLDGQYGSFQIIAMLVLDESLTELSVGDVNHDGRDEVICGGNHDGVNIYYFDAGHLKKDYHCVYGSRGGPRIR